MGFLCRIMRQGEVQHKDHTWRQLPTEKVLEKAGTQPLGTYMDMRQATVAEWVKLRPILEVCDRDTGYKGGERRRELWWRQPEARKQLGATLKEVSAAAR